MKKKHQIYAHSYYYSSLLEESDWILSSGLWDDDGLWDDNETWND